MLTFFLSMVVIGLSNPLHFIGMSSSRYTARIERIRQLAPKVRELTLRLVEPDTLKFLAGQSVAIEVPSSEGRPATVRYYSLASPPSLSTRLVLLVSLADRGSGASYLFQRCEGEIVALHGPQGTFHLHRDEGREVLFVAMGTGIAPFLSMLYTVLETPREYPVRLFWGLRSEHDLYYQEELQALADQHACFSFVMTLSRAQTTWSGAIGRVTNLVSGIASVERLAVYVCGHRKMVNDVTEIIRNKGDCPIYQEQFSPKAKDGICETPEV